MADRNRDDRDTNYFRESYGAQNSDRNRDTNQQRDTGYGNDADARMGYSGYEGRDYADRYSDRGDRTVQGSGAGGRNWAERTGDEVKSWVGDSDAERRREQDRQTIGRYPGEGPGSDGFNMVDRTRDYGARGYQDRTVQGSGAGGRNWAERTGDEMKSWVGDSDAERRREQDRQTIGRYPGEGAGSDRFDVVDRNRAYGDSSRYGGGSMAGYGSQSYGGSDYGSSRYSQGQGYGGRTAPGGGYGSQGNPDRSGYGARSSSYGPSSYSAYDDRGRSYDRGANTAYNADERGFLSKASDEVASWFGDDEAERRRKMDGARDDAQTAFGGNDTQTTGYKGMQSASSSTPHDPHYVAYRQARMDEYDRDYHEYRQTKQKDFHDDFHSWRSTRATGAAAMGAAAGAAASAMTGAAAQVREHQVVVGSDGQGLGKVDHVTASDIKLTKHDSSDGKHHLIPLSWVASVEGDKVKLSKSSDQAMREWRVADGDQNKTSTTPAQT